MKRTIPLIFLIMSVSLMLAVPVAADPQSKPNGPWIQPEQEVRLDSLTSNEDLAKKLDQIAARSKGRVEVETVGESATGWPLHLAKVGEASPDKTRVLIMTQIHGGEPFGTEVALKLLQELGTSSHPDAEKVRDEVTVWFLPRINMDGGGYEEDGQLVQRRHNIQEWTPEEWGLDADAPAPFHWNLNPYSPLPVDPHGYDLNRDFHPDLDFRLGPGDEGLLPGDSTGFGYFVTPEARAVADVYKQLDPDVFIDVHHRGNNVQPGDDDRLTTLQLSGENTTARPGYPLDPEVRELSLQLSRYVYDALGRIGNESSPFDAVSRYRLDWDTPSSALGAFELNGTAAMLFEIRGQVGQKSKGMLSRQTYIGLSETLLGLATGDVYDVDPDAYHDIPPPGPSAGNPRP